MTNAPVLGTAYAPAGKLGPFRTLIVVWIVALANFAGQWSIPVTDRDEARYSQAATQMMETGDYVDIRFQEDPRYVKPAGIYWMQVAATQAFGGPEAPIGAYRIPSYVGIILASLFTAWIGARIAGGAAGALAGGVLGLSLLAGIEARIAKTDAMLLAAGTLAQLGLFMLLVRPKGTGRGRFLPWPFLFWFGSGLAVLIKGPIVTIASVSTILVYVAVTRDWRGLLRLRPLIGLVVFALVGLSWVALITIQSDGEFLRESIGHALLGKVSKGDDSHGGLPGYHTAALLLTFWPGTVLLGLGIAAAWFHRRQPAVIFLLGWWLPSWLVFELIATKLPHYILPTFPALAILAAIGVRDAERLLQGRGTKILNLAFRFLFVIGAAALSAAPFIAAKELGGEIGTPVQIAACAMGVAALFWTLWFTRRPSIARAAWAGLLPIAFLSLVFGGVLPRLDAMWPSRGVSLVASRIEGCEDPIFATAGYREPSNVFYLGTETRLTDGAGAAAFLREYAACGVAIVDRREDETFRAALGGIELRALATVTGTNVSKGRELELTIYVRRDSALVIGNGEPRRL
ncbi:MAG: glycosyltransferase family 39 protein [Parvularcula sp.]|jgi:4-amino-4-deoxy-L-arabinose transferase-like glycosyltransferase|nr:glycosyltransferase family 39 protein [Parvularcula sp.]